jgi:hypothetical protein
MIPEKIEALKICLEFIPGNASVEQVLTEAEKVYRWLADLPAAPQAKTPRPTRKAS